MEKLTENMICWAESKLGSAEYAGWCLAFVEDALEISNHIEIVVKDCKKALKFYKDMFGFELIRDNDGNMELSENLYLQEEKYWERFTGRCVIPQSNLAELYFEEPEIDSFVKKLGMLFPDIEYVNRLMTHSWGQRVVRFYDPDGNLIEVGTPV